MSYCRFSSDNGYCDVYVYEDVSGGWTTHIAGRRPVPGAPDAGFHLLMGKDGSLQAYKSAQALRHAWNKTHPMVLIDHPEAGGSFNHGSPGECADNLERLKSEGFLVPIYAIDTLREEQSAIDELNNNQGWTS